MRLTFWGAAEEVTGSCMLLETGKARVLVDFGIFQGMRTANERNREPLPFDPRAVDAVLVTHAHTDHTGRIPVLAHMGSRAPVYATPPTADLMELLWDDTLDVMQEDWEREKEWPPLYDGAAMAAAKKLVRTVPYGQETAVAPGVTATFHDAGHILGSSFIEVWADKKSVVFSGDLGNRNVPIMRPTERLPACDAAVVEATYGGRTHEDPRTRSEKLQRMIIETVERGGTLLIPAFALERTQELLYELNHLVEHNHVPRVPVFLDSPLAIKATEVFRRHEPYFNRKAACIVDCGDDFFKFPGLTMTPSREESKRINDVPQPKIVIAGSGMMNGGHILHHLKRVLPDKKSTVLVIGYQAAGTLGRRIFDGEPHVRIHGDRVKVSCRVRAIGAYSAHADQDKLIEWLRGGMPKKVFVSHADRAVADAFSERVHRDLMTEATVAAPGEAYEI